jgi:ATP-dependent Zn protease
MQFLSIHIMQNMDDQDCSPSNGADEVIESELSVSDSVSESEDSDQEVEAPDVDSVDSADSVDSTIKINKSKFHNVKSRFSGMRFSPLKLIWKVLPIIAALYILYTSLMSSWEWNRLRSVEDVSQFGMLSLLEGNVDCVINHFDVDIDQKALLFQLAPVLNKTCELTSEYRIRYDVADRYSDIVDALRGDSDNATIRMVKWTEPVFSLSVISFYVAIVVSITFVTGILIEIVSAAAKKMKDETLNLDSNTKFVINKNVKTRFTDVAGLTEAKEEVMKIADIFKNRLEYIKLGARIPTGVLLLGPPGCGKTLLAQAVAGEVGVPFISVNGAEFDEKLVGVGPARMKNMFETARNLAKENGSCIVFIDEIDALGKSRIDINHKSTETLNMILTELDGFNKYTNVMVMAASNIGKRLDPALTRSGRFDHKIYIDPPTKADRVDMFKLYLQKLRIVPLPETDVSVVAEPVAEPTDESATEPTDESATEPTDESATEPTDESATEPTDESATEPTDESATEPTDESATEPTDESTAEIINLPIIAFEGTPIVLVEVTDDENEDDSELDSETKKQIELMAETIAEPLARCTPGMTGADIQNVCNQAAISAARAKKNLVELSDLMNAIDTIGIGIKKNTRKANDKEIKTVAYHEAGHALIGLFLEEGESPAKMTIVPRGEGNLGYTMPNISEAGIYDREYIVAKVMVALGGRIAERIKFDRITTGAGNDLKRVRELVHSYFMTGLSDEYSNIYITTDSLKYMSDDSKENLETSISDMINHLAGVVSDILTERLDDLEILANRALEIETIDFNTIKHDADPDDPIYSLIQKSENIYRLTVHEVEEDRYDYAPII